MRLRLKPHQDFSTRAVDEIAVDVEFSDSGILLLSYTVTGDLNSIVFPGKTSPRRSDNLWKRSCCEAFVRQSGCQSYYEFNFSPSLQWAAYAFQNHRSDMHDVPLETGLRPVTQCAAGAFELSVELDLTQLSNLNWEEPLYLGLSTIIEEKNGYQSLWALEHPSGDPDFHDQACFIHKLRAANQL